MRTVRFHIRGGPEVLQIEDLPVPLPAEGELLIEVTVVGVTFPNVRFTRSGPPGPPPHGPGGDVVGRVAAIGAGVTGWQVGQRVAALSFADAYADLVAVSAAFATPVPDGVEDEAAVPLVRGGQVALGVLHAARVRDGESVLVTAAAGGVGHLAVQLARVAGATRVVAATGSSAAAEKSAALCALGADAVVTYDELAGGAVAPVDVALDGAGGAAQAACVDALAPMGRLVAYSGAGAPVDVNELRLHARTVVGFAMAHFARLRSEVYARHRRELWDLYLGGRLRPLVHRTLPLADAAEAHRILERRENVGRVLLRPAGAGA